MNEPQKRRRGRPALAPGEGKRHPVGIRTTEELKAQIEAAALMSGRSVAAEIEHRLERSFRDDGWLDAALDAAYGSRNAGVLMLLGRVMRDASAFAEATTLPDWLDDHGDFDAVARGLDTVIAALRPCRPAAPNEAGGAAWRAVHNANSVLRLVGDLEFPYRSSGGWADKVRSRLGSVAERLWRHTGRGIDLNDAEETSS
jgi:hypothetical protein